MKQIFEEYGRTIVVAIVVIFAMGLLFVRLDFFGVLGSVADVNASVTHDHGANALSQVVNRDKPTADFSGVNKRICQNQVFQPLKDGIFEDAIGGTPDVVITSILYRDSTGNTTELISHYNPVEKVIVLNPAHYSDSHDSCSISEFTAAGTELVIPAGDVMNSPGSVTVTYVLTDTENQETVEKISFVVDAQEL